MSVEQPRSFGPSAFAALPGHVAVLDSSGVIRLTNRAWNRFAAESGYQDPAAGIGRSYLDVCELARGPDAAVALEVAAGLHRLLRGDEERYSLPAYACHVPDRLRWFSIEAQRLPHGGLVVMHLDVTAVQAELEAHRDARLADPLTGLCMRTLLEDRLAQAISAARGQGRLIGLVTLEIPDLGRVNAQLGRSAGDELLRLVAERVGSRARSSDTVARMSGAELAVLLTNLRGTGDLQVWEEMTLATCRTPARIAGREMTPRIAAGSAVFPRDGATPTSIIAAAKNRRVIDWNMNHLQIS